MRPCLLLHILTLCTPILCLWGCSGSDNPFPRRQAASLVEGFAARAPRDSAWASQFRSLGDAPDSALLKTTLEYGRHMMADGRQADVFDLFTRLIELVPAEEESDPLLRFKLNNYLLLGAAADESGMPTLAQEYYNHGLTASRRLNCTAQEPNFLNNLGVCYFRIRDYERSRSYFKNALELNKQSQDYREIFTNYNNLAEIDLQVQSPQDALNNSLLALQQLDYGHLQESELYFYMQCNIGNLYLEMGNPHMAYSYLTNAINNQRKGSAKADLFESYMCMARLHEIENQPDSASLYTDLAYGIATETGNPQMRARAMEHRARQLGQKGEHAAANDLLWQTCALRDSLNLEENRLRMQQGQKIYEIEQSHISSQSALARCNPTHILLIALALILTLTLLSVMLLLSKRKNRSILAEKSALERWVHEMQNLKSINTEQSMQALREELDETQRRLTTSGVERIRAAESQACIIAELRRLLLEINPRSKEVKAHLRSIICRLQGLSTGGEWNEFQYCFEKVHPGFYTRLAAAHPTLTEKDRRLCALLALGLSTKEIATLTNIEVRSVEANRNRLRKKLGLDPADNLTEYCKSFSN